MKVLIKEHQYSLLLEQLNIVSAYREIVDASSGLGTDPDKILKAFDNIKNVKDFTKLLSMFKDKKTGYDNFSDMINQEYEKFNFDDVSKLKQKLYPLGVIVSYSSGKNYFGEHLFTGDFTFRILNPPNTKQNTKQNNKNCVNKYNPLLVQGKKYWIDWLSNPITKQKFIKNWSDEDYDINDVNEIFKNYINSLNNLKLFFYDNSIDKINGLDVINKRDAYAFVSKNSPNNIYINCSLNDDDAFGTLIHEIQHILYYIHPLNPDTKVGELFVDKNTNKMGPIDFLSNIINPIGSLLKTSKTDNDLSQNIKNISKMYNIKFDELKVLYSASSKYEKKNPGYTCRETEKMSNITSIRKLFNIKPGQNITLKMLSPYIRGEKQHTDVFWLLSCWALSGFSDINVLINKMNQLAYQDFKSNKDNTRVV